MKIFKLLILVLSLTGINALADVNFLVLRCTAQSPNLAITEFSLKRAPISFGSDTYKTVFEWTPGVLGVTHSMDGNGALVKSDSTVIYTQADSKRGYVHVYSNANLTLVDVSYQGDGYSIDTKGPQTNYLCSTK